MIKMTVLRNIVLGILALIVVVGSLRFYNFELQGILLNKPDGLIATNWYQALFYAHITGGIIALTTGLPQFFAGLRRRNLSLHRLLGRIYIIAVAISGLSGLVIALYADGGWVSQTGFFLMACFWLFFSSLAYITIKKKQVEAHQRWMSRSYAVTFSAVTLRLGLLLAVMGWVKFDTIYVLMAWLSWIGNLIIVELFIRFGKKTPTLGKASA